MSAAAFWERFTAIETRLGAIETAIADLVARAEAAAEVVGDANDMTPENIAANERAELRRARGRPRKVA